MKNLGMALLLVALVSSLIGCAPAEKPDTTNPNAPGDSAPANTTS